MIVRIPSDKYKKEFIEYIPEYIKDQINDEVDDQILNYLESKYKFDVLEFLNYFIDNLIFSEDEYYYIIRSNDILKWKDGKTLEYNYSLISYGVLNTRPYPIIDSIFANLVSNNYKELDLLYGVWMLKNGR